MILLCSDTADLRQLFSGSIEAIDAPTASGLGPSLEDRVAHLEETLMESAESVTSPGPWIAWADYLLLLLLLAAAIVIALHVRRQPRRPSPAPDIWLRSLRAYIAEVTYRHFLAFALLVGVPVAALFVLRVIDWEGDLLVLRSLAAWGILVTLIGAYYASRADASAQNALTTSKTTYDAVLNFSESLESFARRVTIRVDRWTEGSEGPKPTLSLLSVIPAFGSVGLANYYASLPSDMPRFHEFVFHKAFSTKIHPCILVTHRGADCLSWLAKVRETSDRPVAAKWECGRARPPEPKWEAPSSVPRELASLKDRLRRDYLVQLATAWAYWRHGGARIYPWIEGKAIPFQFVLLESGSAAQLYFLFSGDQLYRGGLADLNVAVDMEVLQRLTRGYYIDQGEADLLRIFREVLQLHSYEGNEVGAHNFGDVFPERLIVPCSARHGPDESIELLVDIEQGLAAFKELCEYTSGAAAKSWQDVWKWLRENTDEAS